MTLPATIPVKTLDQQHPDYAAFASTWEDIDLLYKDGAALKAQASRFLRKKGRELSSVYAARLLRFTSRPVLGTALGWYQAAMFSNDPQVSLKRDDKTVTDDPFYTEFLGDSDGAGKKFVDVARDVFLSLLKYRSSFVLTDRPAVDYSAFPSLAAQKAAGALKVHLVRYEPSQVINWETDDQGNLEWVLIATCDSERAFPGKVRVVDRWYYFDRTQCAVYEAERKDNGKAENATLMQGYPRPHALSAAKRVPVRWIQVPEGLWLGNRAYLSACTYLDLVNAFDWAIHNGCLPTMWVKGEYKDSLDKSEVGWIGLDENGEIGYLEPAGTTYELAAKHINEVREDLYRQVYIQAQGRSTDATPASQSGYSKEMDMVPSQDVLGGLGDALITGLVGVLADVAEAQKDTKAQFSISGFEFASKDADIMARDEGFLGINLGETVEKEVKKRLASLALKDSDQAIVNKAHQEIDAMPTDAEAAQQQLQGRVMAGFGPRKAPVSAV